MTGFRKLAVRIGMLSLLSVMPLAAQVENGVLFTAPFPFYAGNVEFPAGSYKLTEPDMNYKVALIQNIAGTDGAFLTFTPTTSIHPQKGTDLTFHKYGNTGYLETLSVAGETDGLEFGRTKAEAKAATNVENATVVEHATSVGGE